MLAAGQHAALVTAADHSATLLHAPMMYGRPTSTVQLPTCWWDSSAELQGGSCSEADSAAAAAEGICIPLGHRCLADR